MLSLASVTARSGTISFRVPAHLHAKVSRAALKNRGATLRLFGSGASAGGVLGFPKRHPYAFNIILATVKTSCCDILVQKQIEKRSEIDWTRNGVFVAFGCLYLGVFQWVIYVSLFGRLFPGMAKFANAPLKEKLKDRQGMINLAKQVAFDNFIHYTFIYFPVFYVFKEAIQGKEHDGTPWGIFQGGMGKYQNGCVEDNLKMWALWIPGDFIIYAVPMWLRLPTNHFLSFIWTCYLSFLRGESSEPEPVTEIENVAVSSDPAAEK